MKRVLIVSLVAYVALFIAATLLDSNSLDAFSSGASSRVAYINSNMNNAKNILMNIGLIPVIAIIISTSILFRKKISK